jgi:hypothetical protein
VGRTSRRAVWAIGVIALAIAGCCVGGTNHRCDFSPPDAGGNTDGGADGPMLCGTKVCEPPLVCCLTKAPPLASCIEASMFKSLGCESLPLPCFKPDECPRGMACCVVFDPEFTGGTVNCQPQLQCLAGALSFVACGEDIDCPASRPTCTPLQSTPQGDFKICE